jgi:hypothetical protein
MAYATTSLNDFTLIGTGNTDNPNQLDMYFFSDFIQSAGPSTTTPAQGGVFYLANANGGAVTNNSTAHFAAMGVTFANGTCSIATGTTSNATGYSSIVTSLGILPGIPTPSSSQITKYECETLVRPITTFFGSTTNGEYRFGFVNIGTNASPADGVYIRMLYNGTTNEQTWVIVRVKDAGVVATHNTLVSVAADKNYRLYLCLECNSAGTITTTYNITNVTDNTGAAGTASFSGGAYPSASGDYMGVALTISKQGATTATSTTLAVDYVAARIRRPITRTILLAPN